MTSTATHPATTSTPVVDQVLRCPARYVGDGFARIDGDIEHGIFGGRIAVAERIYTTEQARAALDQLGDTDGLALKAFCGRHRADGVALDDCRVCAEPAEPDYEAEAEDAAYAHQPWWA